MSSQQQFSVPAPVQPPQAVHQMPIDPTQQTVTVAAAATNYGVNSASETPAKKFKNTHAQTVETPAANPPVTTTIAHGTNQPQSEADLYTNRYKLSITKNQWSTGLRGVSILLCVPCHQRFKADRELCFSPEGQQLTIFVCTECVRTNRFARFEYKPNPPPVACTSTTCTHATAADQPTI